MPVPINPQNIHVGRGDIWLGVALPPSGQVVPLDEFGQPKTGFNIGATIEGTNWIYRPTTLDIRTQQSPVLAGAVTTEEEMRLEFSVAEMTYVNFVNMFQTPKDQGGFISLGGLIIPVLNSVLVVSPLRVGNQSGGQLSNAYAQAMLYNAFFTEDRNVAFARQSITDVKVVARGLGVFTRVRGDQLGFFAPFTIGSNPAAATI